MPSVLRKRTVPPTQPADKPSKRKKSNAAAKSTEKSTEMLTAKSTAKAKDSSLPKSSPTVKMKTKRATGSSKVTVGEVITLSGFGGQIETHEGESTTLQKLVDESEKGVVLFTYPKASTPGCTSQARLFRDEYSNFTSCGFSIYGLSKDSPKSNTNFKTKQKLPYTLLCDSSLTLITAIGLKKPPSGIIRGVFVIDKFGKVLAAHAGGPTATVEVVKKLFESDTCDSEENKADETDEDTTDKTG